jgi:hypothetical protein
VLCLQVTWMVAGAASRVRAAGVMGAGGQWQMAAAGQWAAQGALTVVAGRVVVATAGASGAAALAVAVAGVMGAGAVARVVRDGVGEAQLEGLCSNHLCGLTGCRAGRWVVSSQLVVLVGWFLSLSVWHSLSCIPFMPPLGILVFMQPAQLPGS